MRLKLYMVFDILLTLWFSFAVYRFLTEGLYGWAIAYVIVIALSIIQTVYLWKAIKSRSKKSNA